MCSAIIATQHLNVNKSACTTHSRLLIQEKAEKQELEQEMEQQAESRPAGVTGSGA
jgi:hypothetical protein